MAAADIAATLERALPGVTIESWDAGDQPVVVVPRRRRWSTRRGCCATRPRSTSPSSPR